MFCWDLKFKDCSTHEIHKIKCLMDENNFTVHVYGLKLYTVKSFIYVGHLNLCVSWVGQSTNNKIFIYLSILCIGDFSLSLSFSVIKMYFS